jgi:hypothetical protein
MEGARSDVPQPAPPRAHGTLDFRYHRAPGGAADVAAWVAGGPARSAERAPDPTMNFSAAGIAFDDMPVCADGDVLLFELGIPGEPRRWRGGARVDRISPIPIDERDDFVAATHRVAITLDTFADDGLTALQAYTERTRQANGRDR